MKATMMIQQIYCDESGFSGNYLLDREQPFFAYSSVAIDNEEATYLINELRSKYKLQGDELKGKNLVRNNKGESAITWLLNKLQNKARFSVNNKKYALACQMFEYIFEPVLSEQNSLYYRIGFHKFVSNLLYLEFSIQSQDAEDIFIEFEQLMRTKDTSKIDRMLSIASQTDMRLDRPLGQLLTFAACHKNRISDEISSIPGTGIGKWILELSFSALFHLLAYWGDIFESLSVFCDESKPLVDQVNHLEIMIKREEKIYQQITETKYPITFNLAHSIKFVNSKDYNGIQLADILACTVCQSLKNDDEKSRNWRKLLLPFIHTTSVLPDDNFVNLDKDKTVLNAIVLEELLERTLRGKSMTHNMDEFINMAFAGISSGKFKLGQEA